LSADLCRSPDQAAVGGILSAIKFSACYRVQIQLAGAGIGDDGLRHVFVGGIFSLNNGNP